MPLKETLRETSGAPLPPVERVPYQRALEALRTRLGEQAFATAWAQGRTLSLEQALGTPAQGALPPRTQRDQSPSPAPASPPTYPDGLTAREVAVLRVVAQGLTHADKNSDIMRENRSFSKRFSTARWMVLTAREPCQ